MGDNQKAQQPEGRRNESNEHNEVKDDSKDSNSHKPNEQENELSVVEKSNHVHQPTAIVVVAAHGKIVHPALVGSARHLLLLNVATLPILHLLVCLGLTLLELTRIAKCTIHHCDQHHQVDENPYDVANRHQHHAPLPKQGQLNSQHAGRKDQSACRQCQRQERPSIQTAKLFFPLWTMVLITTLLWIALLFSALLIFTTRLAGSWDVAIADECV
mmetsp:Transcript_51557/g.122640  ORF Transcript_51557/g.122640 Transcript_51557/m.122640 type:complete len:215 (+) Transcript_51557:478-1122(+)